MLYIEKNEKDILSDAFDYAKREMKGATLVYASMVGSVSQGGQYADSDYDTRFLYILDSFPEKEFIACDCHEEDVVKRYFPDKVYEWIPFWELTSFFSVLNNPKFLDCEVSLGLYNIVDWTMNSPYVWDPYGLQQKIIPVLQRIYIPENKICAQRKIIEKYYDELRMGDQVIVKSYFYMIHAAATIEYIKRFNTMPPVDIQALLFSLDRIEIYERLSSELRNARKRVRRHYENSNEKIKLQGQHFVIKTNQNDIFDEYIYSMYNDSNIVSPVIEPNKRINEGIHLIYSIVKNSIFNFEMLDYLG